MKKIVSLLVVLLVLSGCQYLRPNKPTPNLMFLSYEDRVQIVKTGAYGWWKYTVPERLQFLAFPVKVLEAYPVLTIMDDNGSIVELSGLDFRLSKGDVWTGMDFDQPRIR